MTNQPVDPQGPVQQQPPSLGLLRDIINEFRLAWRLLLDPRIPLWLKVVPPVTVLYIVMPFDFLPDPILGLGQLDDIAALVLGFRTFIGLCPPDIVQEHRLAIAGAGTGAVTPPSGSGQVIDGSFQQVNSQPPDPQAKP